MLPDQRQDSPVSLIREADILKANNVTSCRLQRLSEAFEFVVKQDLPWPRETFLTGPLAVRRQRIARVIVDGRCETLGPINLDISFERILRVIDGLQQGYQQNRRM